MAYEGPDDPDAVREEWEKLVSWNKTEQCLNFLSLLVFMGFLYWMCH